MLHAFKHAYERLILAADVVEYVQNMQSELNWNEVMRETEVMDIRSLFQCGLDAAFETLEQKTSPETILKTDSSKQRRLALDWFGFVSRHARSRWLVVLTFLLFPKGLLNKIKSVWNMAIPSRQTVARSLNFPVFQIGLRHYLLRIFSYLKLKGN